jgi:hypothetical protein
LEQADDLYLAEVFEEGGHVEQRPVSSIANLFMQEVRVGAKKSADIDRADSLQIDFPKGLKLNDIVGEI